MQDIFLAQILSSRICHDLISPIGAVKTGLELIKQAQEKGCVLDTQVMELIEKSVESVALQLSFYRFVFGYGAANTLKAISQVRPILESYLAPDKHPLEWEISDDFSRAQPDLKIWAQLLAGLALCCVGASPCGGQLTLKGDLDEGLRVVLHAPLLTGQESIFPILENGSCIEKLTPQTVQAYLCYRWAEQLDKKLVIKVKDQNTLVIQTRVH